jgi:hypothetical protein
MIATALVCVPYRLRVVNSETQESRGAEKNPRATLLDEIEALQPQLLKLFALPEYRLPEDIRSYYISDRGPRAGDPYGYGFDLFLLGKTSLTWISLLFEKMLVDRRSIKSFPLSRLRSVTTWQEFATGTGTDMGCTISFDDRSITLPLKDDDREESLKDAARRAVAFGKSVHDAL